MAGRKRFVPTEEQRRYVETMSACGIPQEDIAKVVGITAKTLAKHFRDELDRAETRANAAVAGNLYRIATSKEISGPVVAAGCFWMKTRAGWREKFDHEHSGRGGGPIPVLATVRRVIVDPRAEEPDTHDSDGAGVPSAAEAEEV